MRALFLLAFCATAGAQTYDYTDAVSGTITSLAANGTSITSGTANGSLNAQLVLTNDVLTSFSSSLTINGMFLPVNFGPWQGLAAQGPVWGASTGFITQVGSNFDWSMANQIYHYGMTDLEINGTSDQYSFFADVPGTCGNLLGPNPYLGPAVAVCSLSVKGSAGSWVDPPTVNASVSAPEINPAGAFGAFLLLAGGLAVLRGGKRGEVS